jgi:hypothetical protein
MLGTVAKIITILSGVLRIRRERADARRAREDREFATALKGGKAEEVAKRWKAREKYKA